MKSKIRIFFLSFLGRIIIQLIFYFNKIVIKGEKNLIALLQANEPIMVCVWHGRFLFPSWYLRLITNNIYAIAGKHSDAEIMAQILQYWGYGLIRGSTKKGGKEVIKEMVTHFKKSGIVAITNDGPKGPPCIAKPGSTSIALKNNVKIITVTGSATKCWKINSWDNFLLPKPFGKIQIIISPVMDISKDIINNEVEYVSNFINKYQKQADDLIKSYINENS